jgi:hypothetical protein
MGPQSLNTALVFMSDDRAWIRQTKLNVPDFWARHNTAPALGDILRIGGRQFTVMTRVWDHDGTLPLLRLYLGPGRADSDTSFHGLDG